MGRGKSKYAEGMLRLAEQWPYLRYLGMGGWWAWIWLCYSSMGLFVLGPAGFFAQQVGRMYLFSTPTIMLVLVAAALAWRRVTPLLGDRRFVLGVSLLGVIGTLLVGLAPYVDLTVLPVIGFVLTGLGTSALALKTGEAYGTLGGREVLTAGSISLVLAAFFYFMGIGLPDVCRPFFIAVLPLVGALLYVMPGDVDPFPADVCASAPSGWRAPGMRTYVRIVLASAIVAVTAGFAKGVAAASMPDGDFARVGAISTFAIFLAALAICVAVNSGDIVRSVRRVYAALILLGIAVVFVSVFGVSLAYLGIGKELLWMIFTCLMAYAAFRFGFSPVRAFGFGQAVYLGVSAASWGLGMLCASVLDTPSAHIVLVAAMMLVIALLFVFVFTDSDIKFVFTWRPDEVGVPFKGELARGGGGRPDAEPSDGLPIGRDIPATNGALPLKNDAEALAARIESLPGSLGISSREAQIMLLFAQGRSANWIAEDLVISKNTVRSHIRSIYTKLDVHSRHELLDYLSAEPHDARGDAR